MTRAFSSEYLSRQSAELRYFSEFSTQKNRKTNPLATFRRHNVRVDYQQSRPLPPPRGHDHPVRDGLRDRASASGSAGSRRAGDGLKLGFCKRAGGLSSPSPLASHPLRRGRASVRGRRAGRLLSRDITETHAIGQLPMHDDATSRASAALAFFIPLRLASFIAQLFNAVQPMTVAWSV